MALYRTRLFEQGPDDTPKPPYNGRGWKATYRYLEVDAANWFSHGEARQHHHQTVIVSSEPLPNGDRRLRFAPEIIIEAPDRPAAQRAANLITAAKTLLDGDFMCGDALAVVPDNPENLEDMDAFDYERAISANIGAYWYGTAAAIAAKATRRRRWVFSLVKYWLSLQSCSVPVIELHPTHGTRFMVERDPINHAIMAQAIITAYSAIEALDLQVKASPENPSKKDGRWNPSVLEDLQARLGQQGINLDEPLVWTLRNSPTRIERRHKPPAGPRASWARYSIRDREVTLVDAINYASLLRSRVSSHGTHSLTRSLTMHHVENVQHVARRLLLESIGFWRQM